MQLGIQRSQYVLLIGTEHYAERTKPGSDTNVSKELKFALEEYKKRISSDVESVDFLLPIMLEGDYGVTFSTDVGGHLIRDGRPCYSSGQDPWQSFKNYIGMPERRKPNRFEYRLLITLECSIGCTLKI